VGSQQRELTIEARLREDDGGRLLPVSGTYDYDQILPPMGE